MEIMEDVVNVGGGIAGLSTALALKRVGVQSLVLERSDMLRATGAALTLGLNAWAALDALGVAEKLSLIYTPFQKSPPMVDITVTVLNKCKIERKGATKKNTTAKQVVIIGDNPKPKWKKKRENFTEQRKPTPLYNHYASGSGWWDCDREGIDNEEVGCSDAWEGMGATTNLGGLDWH